MSTFIVAIVCLNSICKAGTWRQTGDTLFTIMDIGINSPNATFSTELSSSGSWLVKSNNLGKSWTTLQQSNDGLLDIACSSLDNQHAVVSSITGRVMYTQDGGNQWETSLSVLFGAQSIQRSRDGSNIFCGAGGNKISVSSNKGITWNHFGVGALNNGSRYCAMPTSKVWYITAGFWIDDDQNENDQHFALTSKLSMNTINGQFVWRHDEKNKVKKMEDVGMWAELWKTSDGGGSWTRQVSSNDKFYFNAIDCCDENHCIAVAEGDQEAGSNEPGSRIFLTLDGKTWNQVWYDSNDASSMMTCHCVSDLEYFAGGGDIESGRGFGGHFLHTVDGGTNWMNITAKAPIMWMDMSDDSKYGVASGISKSSGGVEFGFE